MWTSLIFTGLALAVVAVVYFNRMTLLERVFLGVLGDRGLQAELEVERFTPTELVLRDLVLREDGTEVLTARRVAATYRLREALGGAIRTLDVEGARLRVDLDANLRIAEGWLRPSGNGGGGLALPSEGTTVVDSRLDLRSPYGDLDIGAEGRLYSVERFAFDLALAPSTLRYRGIQGTLSGTADLAREGGSVRVRAVLAAPRILSPRLMSSELDAERLALDIDGAYDPNARGFTGDARLRAPAGRYGEARWSGLELGVRPALDLEARRLSGSATLTLDALDHGDIRAEALVLRALDGFALDFAADLEASGPIEMTAERLRTLDLFADALRVEARLASTLSGTARIEAARAGLVSARAEGLARTLSLADTLALAPVTRDFAPGLTDDLAATLRGGALATRIAYDLSHGNLARDADGARRITLLDPLTLRGAQTLRVAPIADTPTYSFFPEVDQLVLRLAAALTGPRALDLRDVVLEAASPDGLSVAAVQRFEATLATRDWAATTPEGRASALATTTARLRYTPAGTDVVGALGFTGDIPGGYVEGLALQGRLALRPGERLSVGFDPETDVVFSRLTLPSGGRVEDFRATLIPDTPTDGPMLLGGGADGDVQTALADASFAYRFETADGISELVEIAAARLQVQGRLRAEAQDWTVDLSDARLASDTFIGAGTTAEVPEGVLTARLATGAPLAFTFDSSSIRATTPLVRVRDMPVALDGTLESFEARFGPGRLRASDERIPVTRVEGLAIFRNGEWVGEAAATIPDIPTEPLRVEFQYADGAGVADVVFADVVFEPEGGLQPQDYIPALRGKISQVAGSVSGQLQLGFGVGQPLESSGVVELDGLDFGTAPGPITGLRTRIAFDSLLPLRTTGRQTLTLELFDPGLPLPDGEIVYELLPEGIRVHAAVWPLGDGEVRLEPLVWEYAAEVNTAVLVIDGVSLQAFLDSYGQENLRATGELEGRLPVEVRGVQVEVREGRIAVPSGGRIRYASPQTDTAAAQNETTQLVFDSLRDFRYQSLGLSIDGPLDGEITLEAKFTGRTPDDVKIPRLPSFLRFTDPLVFEFDISITGELFNIIRSLDPTQQLNRIKLQLQSEGGLLPSDLGDAPDPETPIQEENPPLMPGSASNP